VCVRHDVFPSLRHAAKKFAAGDSIAAAIYRFNDHRQGSSTPIRPDKQMPNTGLAPRDTVTEPAIAGESDVATGPNAKSDLVEASTGGSARAAAFTTMEAI
jgi:hypothetical protein